MDIDFKQFIAEVEANAEQGDVKKTLSKLPKAHYALVKDYKIVFQKGNALQGDHGNIGEIDEEKKKITIAAPWHYGREYTLLHEVGHLVWKYLVDKNKKKEWMQIVKNTESKQNQGGEELYCMAYADFYAKHKVVVHNHPEWEKFIKGLPK